MQTQESLLYSSPLLLYLMNYSWDRTRVQAAELLKKFPRPLPGFETPAHVNSLVLWGMYCTAIFIKFLVTFIYYCYLLKLIQHGN